MNLIENVTKFTHKSMPSWGIGTLRKSEEAYITVDFENAGIKKFGINSINTNLLIIGETPKELGNSSELDSQSSYTPVNTQNGSLLQFDGESNGIGGRNIIEAFKGNDTVIFNETYIIIGEQTEALKIHAMYDLTVIGDVIAQECSVNGTLTIIGNARIANISCQNGFTCKGDLYSGKVYVGGDMIVNSVICDELTCDGNVIIQTTANINQAAQITKTAIACEGIMGAGKFSAQNAIANEYFEFEGDYEGKILELESDALISDAAAQNNVTYETIEEIIALVNRKLTEEYSRCSSLDEEQLLLLLHSWGSAESKELKALPIIEPLFSRLTDMSYQNRIETIEDYLTVLAAKELLPEDLFSYESVEHIGKLYLPKARKEIIDLNFKPSSVKQFAQVLLMAVSFEEDLSDEWNILMDKIFESVGLKYATVSSMIRRNKPNETENPQER